MIKHNLFKEYNCSTINSHGIVTSGSIVNNSDVFVLGEKDSDNTNVVSLWKISKDKPVLTLKQASEVTSVKFSYDDLAA